MYTVKKEKKKRELQLCTFDALKPPYNRLVRLNHSGLHNGQASTAEASELFALVLRAGKVVA